MIRTLLPLLLACSFAYSAAESATPAQQIQEIQKEYKGKLAEAAKAWVVSVKVKQAKVPTIEDPRESERKLVQRIQNYNAVLDRIAEWQETGKSREAGVDFWYGVSQALTNDAVFTPEFWADFAKGGPAVSK